jgi:hypothetical protein
MYWRTTAHTRASVELHIISRAALDPRGRSSRSQPFSKSAAGGPRLLLVFACLAAARRSDFAHRLSHSSPRPCDARSPHGGPGPLGHQPSSATWLGLLSCGHAKSRTATGEAVRRRKARRDREAHTRAGRVVTHRTQRRHRGVEIERHRLWLTQGIGEDNGRLKGLDRVGGCVRFLSQVEILSPAK